MKESSKDKLVDEANRCSSNNQVVALYSEYTREELERNTLLIEEMEEAREKGLREGRQEGIKEGTNRRNIEIATELKNRNS